MAEGAKIIIAEDHDLFRDTVSGELKRLGIEVIGTVGNGRELLEMLETSEPDVVLLDLQMPEMDGRQAFETMRARFPQIKTIIFSQHTDAALMENYFARGAYGFLSKDFISTNMELLAAEIQLVQNSGKAFYYASLASRIKYSRREVEIIPFICRGETSKEIANRLGIGEKAVNKHRKELYRKTHTRNSAEFIHYALKRGLDFLGAISK